MQSKVVHVRFHPDLDARIRKEAERQHISMSALVTLAVNALLDKLDAERRRR